MTYVEQLQQREIKQESEHNRIEKDQSKLKNPGQVDKFYPELYLCHRKQKVKQRKVKKT